MSVQKGKELDHPHHHYRHHRVPFGELEAPPAIPTPPSVSPALASTHIPIPTIESRAPTPFHPSDDLEDMYYDPHELKPSEEQTPRRQSEPYILGEEPPLVLEYRQVTDEEYVDPTATPEPQHVANIIPEAWPSSDREATPCDRSLPESPASSPSPMKPLLVPHPLPVAGSSTAKKQSIGKYAASKVFPSSTPIPTPLPAAKRAKLEVVPLSTRRLRSINTKEVKKEGKAERLEDPTVVVRGLEELLPKQMARKSAPFAALPDTSPTRSTRRVREQEKEKGKGRVLTSERDYLGSDAESGGGALSDGERPSASPLTKGKRKAPTRKIFPVKRQRVEVVITKRPPTPSRAKPASTLTRAKHASKAKSQTRTRDKGKGKANAGPRKVGDEDSVRVPRLRD